MIKIPLTSVLRLILQASHIQYLYFPQFIIYFTKYVFRIEIQEPPHFKHIYYSAGFFWKATCNTNIVLVSVICAHMLMQNRQKFHKVEYIYSLGPLNSSWITQVYQLFETDSQEI